MEIKKRLLTPQNDSATVDLFGLVRARMPGTADLWDQVRSDQDDVQRQRRGCGRDRFDARNVNRVHASFSLHMPNKQCESALMY